MPIDPVQRLDIIGAATKLFDTLTTVLTDDPDFVMPALTGIVPGSLVAFDGEQFTVNWMNVTRGFPGQPSTQTMQPWELRQYYEFEVNLLREVPVIDGTGIDSIPSIPDQVKSAQQLMTDAAALWAAIVAIHAAYAIVAANVPFIYGPMSSLGPDGGLGGSRLPVYWSAT